MFVPITLLVPFVTVIGRSVSSLKVKHLMFRNVVSSWSPPESVKTRSAPETNARKLMYGRGSMNTKFSNSKLFASMYWDNLGCAGITIL